MSVIESAQATKEPAPDPRPAVDALRTARGIWESDQGPLSSEEQEWSDRVHY